MDTLSTRFLRRFSFVRGDAASSFLISRWIFLRLLGCVYLAAFLSLWVQVHGLVGSQGILPVQDFLAAARQVYGSIAFIRLPTLCWIDPSDQGLTILCGGGTALSFLLVLGVAQIPVLILLWACYLSLTVAGQVFLGYQWDALLLETGFLAIFFAPLHMWPRLRQEAQPSIIVLWLFRWLLFRLIFTSGAVKLMSGDPTWRDLTALQYHYETQPLPTWTSWYMHQLPSWFQQLSVVVTFVAEIVVPVLIFLPRPFRHIGCVGIIVLQVIILATGNYGFFNLLTMALCILLLDDDFYPSRLRSRLARAADPGAAPKGISRKEWLFVPLAVFIACMSLVPFVAKFIDPLRWPSFVLKAYGVARSFESVNTYGLFAVMTTERNEIIVEGSDDGRTWKAYEFKWKPGDLKRRPRFMTPHLPRLDWQMWFAALGRYEDNPWFQSFLVRILQGAPDVLALLEQNPFPDRPPRYIRALFYEYHFTDSTQRQESAAWWRRKLLGRYGPVLGANKTSSRLRAGQE